MDRYKLWGLNVSYLLISCLYTSSLWLYSGIPELQLLLQSIMKIILVSILCKIKTGSMPRIIIYDKFLFLSAVIYSGSSLCTSYLWLTDGMTPYTYSMGTKPALFVSNVIQNGVQTNLISFFSITGLIFVNKATIPLFLLKCFASSIGSYFSALGLNFGKDSGFEQRCSKIISFSLISTFIPFLSSNNFYVKHEFLEYFHAMLGALNGLCIAFVLSYNGALVKIGLSSIKDLIFIFYSGDLKSLNVASLFFQAGVATWISFTQNKNMKEQNKDTKEIKEDLNKLIDP